MNDTPTPKTDAIPWIPNPIFYNSDLDLVRYVRIKEVRQLERELTAVTKQLKAAQDGWHDEITKGLSELRRAESIYTQAQERAERAEEQRDQYKAALESADNHNHEIATKLEIVTEQRDRLAEALQTIIRIYEKPDKGCIPCSSDMYDVALQSMFIRYV